MEMGIGDRQPPHEYSDAQSFSAVGWQAPLRPAVKEERREELTCGSFRNRRTL
jgi:hypothetical protein